MSSCTTYLLRNSVNPIFLAKELIDLLGFLLIIAWITPTHSGVLIRTVGVRLPMRHTFLISIELVQVFLNILYTLLRLTPKLSEIFFLAFTSLISRSTACHLQISGRLNYVMVLFSLHTVLNWFLFAAQLATKKAQNRN